MLVLAGWGGQFTPEGTSESPEACAQLCSSKADLPLSPCSPTPGPVPAHAGHEPRNSPNPTPEAPPALSAAKPLAGTFPLPAHSTSAQELRSAPTAPSDWIAHGLHYEISLCENGHYAFLAFVIFKGLPFLKNCGEEKHFRGFYFLKKLN